MERQKGRQIARLAKCRTQITVERNDAFQVAQEFEKLIGLRTCPVISFTHDCFKW